MKLIVVKFCFSFLVAAAALSYPSYAEQWKAPTSMKKLPNGLIVVVSEDHSAPTFGLCISYGIGFRLEPEGRTGFAHLFEHMMFEGTPNAQRECWIASSRAVEETTTATLDTITPSTSRPHRFLRLIPCSGSRPTASKPWTSRSRISRTSATL